MKIVSEKTLALFRTAGPCEYCGRYQERREPHHYWSFRGLGGAYRLDVPENLIALCWRCHHDGQRGAILRVDFLAKVAAREGRLQHEIEAELTMLRNLDKWADYEHAIATFRNRAAREGRGRGAAGNENRREADGVPGGRPLPRSGGCEPGLSADESGAWVVF